MARRRRLADYQRHHWQVATASTDLRPSSETEISDTWTGQSLYLQAWNGVALTNSTTLISSGVEDVIGAWGWAQNSLGNRFDFPYTSDSDIATVYVNTSGALVTLAVGGFTPQAYDFTVAYTKTG